MKNKWALEEHLSTAENNALWDLAGESARNGKALTEYVEAHLQRRLRLRRVRGTHQ